MTAYRPVLDGMPSLAASYNKMLMRAATVVSNSCESLAGLVLCFIVCFMACFILLVIAPLRRVRVSICVCVCDST